MRAKVAALETLKGHRADMGLQRAWEGNYLVSVIGGSFSSFSNRYTYRHSISQLLYHKVLNNN